MALNEEVDRPSAPAGGGAGGAVPGAREGAVSAPLSEYPHVPLLVTLLFCGYVVIWYLQIGYRFPALGAIRFEFIYAAVLTVVAVVSGVPLRSPLTGFLVLLFITMLAGVPFSHDPTTSYNVFIDRVVKFFFMAVFIVAFVKGPRSLKWFLGAFLLACFKMGQEGFLGWVTGSMIWENQGVMRLHGATPIYAHPNSFAGMALGTVPFVVYLFPISTWPVRLFLLVQSVFAASIILFSGSRTAYVAAVGFALFVLLRARRRLVTLTALVVVAVALVVTVPQDYKDRFVSIYTGVEKEGQSTEARKQILRDAWAIFIEHPLGVGIAAFPAVRESIFGRKQDTHNLYLEVATNIGLQGLIAFLLFVGAQLVLLSRLGSTLARQRLSVTRAAPAGTTALPESEAIVSHRRDLALMAQTVKAVQAFIVMRLALGLFGMDLYEIYWWFAMGLTIALLNMAKVALQRTAALAAARGDVQVAGPIPGDA